MSITVLSVMRTLYFGGDQYRLLAFTRELDRSEFDHKIVCIKGETPELAERFGSLRSQFIEAGAEIIDLDVPEFNKRLPLRGLRWAAYMLARTVRTVSQVASVVRKEGVDVLDGHTATGNPVAVLAGLLTGRPAAVTTYNAEKYKPYAFYYVIQQAMFACASVIITDAEMVRRVTHKFMLKKGARVEVIPNGAPQPVPERSPEEVRAFFDLPDDDALILGTIASLYRKKGQLVLLDAIARVLERHPNTYALIVGYDRKEAGYVDELWERARELGIADRVRIKGYPGKIGDVWQLIDIHVHPSMKDALPDAIIQGMSLRKPRVVTDVGDIPQKVTDGVTGFVVPNGDPEALASRIIEIIENPELAREFGERGRERYEREFRPDAMTRALENVFRDLVVARGRQKKAAPMS